MRIQILLALFLASLSLHAAVITPEVTIIPNPGTAFSDSRRTWQGIPSIEHTPGGKLVVAWYSGGDREGSPENYCLLAVSTDTNRTWSAAVLVVQGTKGVRTGEPLPWLDPSGRLWLFWNHIHPDKAHRGTWAIRCDNPDAAQMTWTAPQFIGHGIVLGKPIVTTKGEWLAPLDVRNDTPLAAQIGKNRAGVIVSTDKGVTWTWRGGWQLPDDLHDFDEHCIVERKDGSLWAILRLKGGLRQSTSTDGGKTWTEPSAFLNGARTRAYLGKLASGRYLMLYHDGPGKETKDGMSYRRESLTAFLSEDEGKTWKKKLLLDPRNRVSYPDATQTPDGRIWLTYDYARYLTGCKEILTLGITEEDILKNRALPTPTLVNRATAYGNIQEVGEGNEDKMRDKANKELLKGQPK
jgi:hypothetical protein